MTCARLTQAVEDLHVSGVLRGVLATIVFLVTGVYTTPWVLRRPKARNLKQTCLGALVAGCCSGPKP